MKRLKEIIVFCISITPFIVLPALPVVAQSRGLEWGKNYFIYSGDDATKCVIKLNISGQKDDFLCSFYQQDKDKKGITIQFSPKKPNPLELISVFFVLNQDYTPRGFALASVKEGIIVASKGKVFCKEISEPGEVGHSCAANVTLEDGRKAIVIATFATKM
jgi:hypothetical protein